MDKKKILVVDDEIDALEAIKARLEANNYLAIGSSRAKEVLALAREGKPDLIILDIVMPDMNGYEVCQLLKQDEETAGIPILLLTGEALEPRSITEQCLKLGAQSYLLKPIIIQDLLAKIKELLKEK